MRKSIVAAAFALCAVAASSAHASPITGRPATSFASSPFTLALGGVSDFVFSNSGDFYNPVSIATGGTGLVAAFGGFLGIPLAPTSFFTDPGRAPFIDGGQNYEAFPTGGGVGYSLSPGYLALAFTEADGVHYGYALTEGARLVTYGYESVAGVGIQAPAIPTPEPATLAMLGLGMGGVAVGRIRRRG